MSQTQTIILSCVQSWNVWQFLISAITLLKSFPSLFKWTKFKHVNLFILQWSDSVYIFLILTIMSLLFWVFFQWRLFDKRYYRHDNYCCSIIIVNIYRNNIIFLCLRGDNYCHNNYRNIYRDNNYCFANTKRQLLPIIIAIIIVVANTTDIIVAFRKHKCSQYFFKIIAAIISPRYNNIGNIFFSQTL